MTEPVQLPEQSNTGPEPKSGQPMGRTYGTPVVLRREVPEHDSLRVQGWPITGPWPKARITHDQIYIYEPGHAYGISREEARRLASELLRCEAELQRESRS